MNYFEVGLAVLSFAVNTYVAFSAYRRRPRGWTTGLVMVLWALLSVYLFTNYLSLHPPSASLTSQLFWIRLVIADTSMLFPVVAMLAMTIPGPRLGGRPWQIAALLAIGGADAILAMTPLMFSSLSYVRGIAAPTPGPAIVFHALNFTVCYLVAAVVFVRRYHRAALAEKPVHLFYFLGLSVSQILSIAAAFVSTNIIATTTTVFLGPIVWSILFVFLNYLLPRVQLESASSS